MPDETQTSRSGQTLVRVKRPVGRPRKDGLPPGSVAKAEPEAPRREPGAERKAPELVTPYMEVPPDELDPKRRSQATIGMIELTEDGKGYAVPDVPEPKPDPPDFVAATDQPRTLDDLFAVFPVGDGTGQFYIHVERKTPAAFNGVATRGIMRRIRAPMTFEAFRELYGGGTYHLIAYGPPKRGGVMNEATGFPYPKALTKPVVMTIPWQVNGGWPPNPEVAFEIEEEDDYMQNHHMPPGPFGRVATPAAAQMYKTGIEAEDRREQRRREEIRERRRREQETERTAIGVIAESATRREERMAEEARELREQVREASSRSGTDLEGIARLLQTMGPQRATQSELEALRDSHRRELENMERRHSADIENLTRRAADERNLLIQNHKHDIDREANRARDTEQRAADRVRDVEKRLDEAQQRGRDELERLRSDLTAQHQRELESVRNESTRTLDALRTNYDTRIASEARSWEREIQTRNQIHESNLVTERTRLETQIEQLKGELRRRDNDNKELKELAAKNKDFGRLMDEARKTAELLGYAPREENAAEPADPPDVKTMIFGVLTEGAKRLPELLKSMGDAAAAMRHGPAAAQQAQAQQHMQAMQAMQQAPHPAYAPQPRQMQPPRTFATENDEQTSFPQFFEQGQGVRPPPLPGQPTHREAPAPLAPPPVAMEPVGMQPAPVPEQHMAVQGGAMPAAMPAVTGQMVVAEPAPAPVGQPSVRAPAPAPPPPVEGNPALDGHVLNMRAEMEAWYENRVPPEEIAKGVVERFGAPVVKGILPTLSRAVVTGALKRANLVDSPLLTRRGRRYIESIEQAVKSLVQ